jgi:branched-subunit amino acid transport protein
MKGLDFWIYLLILSGSTYLIRTLPFAAIKHKIENRFIRSFLQYIPYAVLTAMTLPAVLYTTDYITSAAIGLAISILFAYRGKSLTTVAIAACLGVFITECFLSFL